MEEGMKRVVNSFRDIMFQVFNVASNSNRDLIGTFSNYWTMVNQ